MVGVKKPEIKTIRKLTVRQYLGNIRMALSVFNCPKKVNGTCERIKRMTKRIISKLITSSRDQVFSKVFSP